MTIIQQRILNDFDIKIFKITIKRAKNSQLHMK